MKDLLDVAVYYQLLDAAEKQLRADDPKWDEKLAEFRNKVAHPVSKMIRFFPVQEVCEQLSRVKILLAHLDASESVKK